MEGLKVKQEQISEINAELLEALKEIKVWNDADIKGFNDIQPTMEMLVARRAVIRKAIAKAEGRA